MGFDYQPGAGPPLAEKFRNLLVSFMLLSLLSGQLNILAFVFLVVGLLVGITVHEFAHAYVAYRNGDPTAKNEGRMTLNPLAHLDPLGTIMIVFIGFGYGKPVPVDPRYYKSEWDMAKVDLAGIVTNLIVAMIFAVPIRLATLHGQDISASALYMGLHIIVQINLMLAVFNILPIPPLDGSHLIEYLMGPMQRMYFQRIGPMLLYLLVFLDIAGIFPFFSTVVTPAITLLARIFEGISISMF